MNMYVKMMKHDFDIVLYARLPNTKIWRMLVNYTHDDNKAWEEEQYSFDTKTELHKALDADRGADFEPLVIKHKEFKLISKALDAEKGR